VSLHQSTFDRIRVRSRVYFLTWEGIAAIAAVAAAGMGAYSSVAAGDNARDTANYNAQVQQNAAKDAENRGAVAAAEHDQQTRLMIARQNATMSASGLDTSSGTPLDILTGTAGMGKLDSLRILNNAQRQADGLNAQAGLDLFRGNASQNAGYFGAGGSILGGIGSATSGYYGSKANQALMAQD
jgi:hypothetical protein